MKKPRDRIQRVVAYCRVSSLKQDLTNQHFEINTYARKLGLEIDEFFELQLSATKNGMHARRIDELLQTLKKGDILLVSELSRLGRSIKDLSFITDELFKKGIETHCIKQGLVLKQKDLTSKILVWAFSLCAEVESDLISQRTKGALANAKFKGVKLGNPNLRQDHEKRAKNTLKWAQTLKPLIQPMVENGKTQQEIVDALNEAQIPARKGGKWHRTGLLRVLKTLEM